MSDKPSSLFQRFLLPGLAFKAVVIGGGYATGRELAEFFLPLGPLAGLLGMMAAMALWSLVCAVTFLFARATDSQDYRTFFKHLLGRGWWIFELAYFGLILLILSVFAAAAGAIGRAVLGAPEIAGTLALAASILIVTTFGNYGVEGLFKYVSFLLYGVYALFLALMLARFGEQIGANLTAAPVRGDWPLAGLAYAGYNVVGAVVILPVTRHMRSQGDAVIAGLLCGPLAMAPAILFFVCMAAFFPQIGGEALPSNFMLSALHFPAFQVLFQAMIFAALLESGTGCVHAVNQRVAAAWATRGRRFAQPHRLVIGTVLLATALIVANRFGLIALIAKGYRGLTLLFLAVYILPLLTLGAWRLWTGRATQGQP